MTRILTLALVLLTGCAAATRAVTREATATALSTSLRTLNEQQNQQLIAELMDSPEVRAAAGRFAEDAADGTLALLSEPERAARIEALTARYVAVLIRATTRGLAAGIRRDLAPVMAEAVRGAMREVFRDGLQRDVERAAAGVTHATVRAATHAMAEGMREDFGPMFRGVLRDENNLREASAAARVLAREAVFGSNDALSQIQRDQERRGRPSFLGRMSNMTENGARIAAAVAALAFVLIVGLAIWVARLATRSRRVEAENERNATAAAMLAEAIRASEGKPWGNELTQLIQERLQRDSVTGLLNSVLEPRAAPRKVRRAKPAEPAAPTGRPSFHGT